MLKIRIVKTASKSRAVQLIYYKNRKRIVYKHIGSAKTDAELEELIAVAQNFINQYTPVLPFFEENISNNLFYIDKCEFRGVYYTFFHQIFE